MTLQEIPESVRRGPIAAFVAWCREKLVPEDQILALIARYVNPAIVGARVQSEQPMVCLTNMRTGVTRILRSETPAVALTDAERREIPELKAAFYRGALDRAGQDRLLGLLDRSLPDHARANVEAERARAARKAGRGGPVRITDAEAAALKAAGHDPEMLRRAGGIHSVEDYRRVKAEVEAAR